MTQQEIVGEQEPDQTSTFSPHTFKGLSFFDMEKIVEKKVMCTIKLGSKIHYFYMHLNQYTKRNN